MTKDQVLQYVQEEYGVVADYPFSNEYTPSPVLRHKHNKKWFALLMNIPLCKLTGKSQDKVWAINVKCDQFLKPELLKKKGIYPAYHMSKIHWITAILNETEDEIVKMLIETSFFLTK